MDATKNPHVGDRTTKADKAKVGSMSEQSLHRWRVDLKGHLEVSRDQHASVLNWVVITQAHSLCKNSSGCIFIISALFVLSLN